MRNMIKDYHLRAIIAFFIIALLASGCSDNGDSGTNDPEPEYDIYVDAVNGSNDNTGGKNDPLRTITFAMTRALRGDTIKIAPGNYDTTLGEIFPVTVPDNVTLIGDIDHKGEGTTPTVITGVDSVDNENAATLVAGASSYIAGLKIVQPGSIMRYYCVLSDGDNVTLSYNTFESQYGCLRLLGTEVAVVEYNHLSAPYYGIYSHNTGNTYIRYNQFLNGTYIEIADGHAVITNNTFTGDSFRAISIQRGTSQITNNYITGSYFLSAMRFLNACSPKVRNNTIHVFSGDCIQILGTARPDLGTAADLGQNVFSGTSGVAVVTESPYIIQAIGNTWFHSSPICGSEIVVNSSGSLAYGTGPGDTCYLVE
ncbi:MAG: DUF1565 domain-containing protein [Candidatus Zixiibacteriota bacterium]